MAQAIFTPQAWVNDYAIEVDPEGPVAWPVEDEHLDVQPDTYESDELRFHANAPLWVQNWSGPFYITIVED